MRQPRRFSVSPKAGPSEETRRKRSQRNAEASAKQFMKELEEALKVDEAKKRIRAAIRKARCAETSALVDVIEDIEFILRKVT